MPIPSKGTRLKTDDVKRHHDDYTNGEQRLYHYRWYRESYEGSGGYAPWVDPVTVADSMPEDTTANSGAGASVGPDMSRRTYLFKHPKEGAKFQRRVMMAYLPNVIKRTINMLVGFLTKQTPTRDGFPTKLNDWLDDCNSKGDSWDSIKATTVIKPTMYYGVLPVLVHKELRVEADTAAQDINQVRTSPFSPEAIVDWIEGEDGYAAIKVLEVLDQTQSLIGEKDLVDRYWFYEAEGWYYVDTKHGDDERSEVPVVASGTWSDGLPMVTWRTEESGTSTIGDAVSTQRELYNACSELTEQRRQVCFAWLTMPNMGEQSKILTAGSGNVLWAAPDANFTPYYLSPPMEVFDAFKQQVEDLATQILADIGITFDSGGSASSGMAMSFQMSPFVRMLKDVATCLQRYENRTLREVAKQLDVEMDDEAKSVWPTEFDAKDVQKEIEALVMAIETDLGPSLEEEAKMRIATTTMPDLSEELRDKGRKEIAKEISETKEAEKNADDLDAEAARGRIEAAKNGMRGGVAQIDGEKEKVPDARAR
jgi:hypothetical protein